MDLPDCPPGAEGYEDSVVEVAKIRKSPEESCTKAEQEFQEHLNSLRIKVEDGSTRCMVERRERDASGNWIYLCFPCAAMCSGESTLQTHISGKKHEGKLQMKNVWPISIFEMHPYIRSETGAKNQNSGGASDTVPQKKTEEVDLRNKPQTDLFSKYDKYRNVRCHLQDIIDDLKVPLLGLEYLIEHAPEQAHYEPNYMCTLCTKQGQPRTIINHLTGFWHRYNYFVRHYPKAWALLNPFRTQQKYREGLIMVMNRLAQRIQDTYGRLKPVNIDKDEFESNRESIHRWIFNGKHFSETEDCTFEEVVNVDLLSSLKQSSADSNIVAKKKDPSPPVVEAPTKPQFNKFTRTVGRQQRRTSLESLSDVSDEQISPRRDNKPNEPGGIGPVRQNLTTSPLNDRKPYELNSSSNRLRQEIESFRDRYAAQGKDLEAVRPKMLRRFDSDISKTQDQEKSRPPNYEYKVKLAEEKWEKVEISATKTLAYHEKNPEKHPLYPEEWKKFWNKRYKQLQAEGKDASKYDFKPEWIEFWTKRMKELHEEELRVIVHEIYRKLTLTPPNMNRRFADLGTKVPENRRRSPDVESKVKVPRRRSPVQRRRSPDYPRRRTPDSRRRTPDHRRRSPDSRKRSPDSRRRSPPSKRRTPEYHRPEVYGRPLQRQRSPRARHLRTRSRSPVRKSRSPMSMRPRLELEVGRRSRSPLSRRDSLGPRNRSPAHQHPQRPRYAEHQPPSLQTVLVSDDELKPDDGGLSPWNSDNDIESVDSRPRSMVRSARSRSRTGSVATRSSAAPPRGAINSAADLGPAENVVATLRLLVALEDYLGSIGPKIVSLLTEALRMEKESGNSSEELLERESAMVLIETAKEKLKGAAQAGLVPDSATKAVRAAVVRAAATLHEADTRSKRQQKNAPKTVVGGSASDAPPVSVAGVGAVDRAEIAQQMAEALIAQGKTDVSAEELAQLVDAVVGMAEAKKREEAKTKEDKNVQPSKKTSARASALQMLQSAYDEKEKRIEKDDVPDAMDGLSDMDLEMLLKNFNELSADEQHSLIAYLKKLESRNPVRVEKLRQYVSAAATEVSIVEDESPAKKKEETKQIALVSDDDDDYTVEEMFKSATQRVKENQTRQELEIVKKSLEETKVPPIVSVDSADLSKNMTSATDLFALVQASIQSSILALSSKTSDTVASNKQPRTLGDDSVSSASAIELLKSFTQKPNPISQNEQQKPLHQENDMPVMHQQIPVQQPILIQQQIPVQQHIPVQQQIPIHQLHNQNQQQPQHNIMQQQTSYNPIQAQRAPYNRIQHQQPFNTQQSDFRSQRPQCNTHFEDRNPSQQPVWEPRPLNTIPDNRGVPNRGPAFDSNFNQGVPYSQGPRGGNFMNSMHVNHQNHGNYNQNSYGRGGRGGFGGGPRGRGRGGYY